MEGAKTSDDDHAPNAALRCLVAMRRRQCRSASTLLAATNSRLPELAQYTCL